MRDAGGAEHPLDTSLPHLQSRERSPLFSDLSRRSLSEPAQSVAPVAQDKYGNLGHQRGSAGENSRRSATNAARVVAPTEEMFVIQPWHGRGRVVSSVLEILS
jgi:hypothetical protein